MVSSVLTVSQVNFFLKSLIEGDARLNDFFITGEISNYTDHYSSGHLYFSLKDEKSVIKAVMFSSAAKRLRFKPSSGMKVIIRGRVSVYEPSGQYQLYVNDMQPDGLGALSLAYEQLKERLEQEGLFSADRKKTLPPYPKKIGVITSPTGAAVRDIIQVTGRRWPMAEIVLKPVLVQGSGAAKQLTEAVALLNRHKACDLIIIGRGGGSLEDLWAFNDESLAREIYRSEIPVISAVGHETDFTICDFVSDLRAPTPSAAAELATPALSEECRKLWKINQYCIQNAIRYIEDERQALDLRFGETVLHNPSRMVTERHQALQSSVRQLSDAYRQIYNKSREQLIECAARLDALSPLKIMARGYAVVYRMDDVEAAEMLRRKQDVSDDALLSIRFADGCIAAKVTDMGDKQ